MRKNKLIILVIILMMVLSFTSCQNEVPEEDDSYYKAKIIGVSASDHQGNVTMKDVELEILEGPYEGEIFHSMYGVQVDHYKNFSFLNENDKMLVQIWENSETGGVEVYIMDHYRVPQLAILFILFLVAIIALGRLKGLKTVVALVLTIACVVYILIPMISTGHNAVFWALLCGVLISSITLIIIGGFNRKTFSAVLGTFLGLVCAGILTLIISQIMHISNIKSEDVELIALSNIDFDLDIRGMFTAGIFIGCLGAVMDVGMSLSSSIAEIKLANPDITVKNLRKAGMRVGHDIMGTMSNTLILAYTGGTLMQMVVWKIYGISFLDMLNYEFIVTEIVSALAGSFGMLLTIPLTCIIASKLISFDAHAFIEQHNLNEEVE